MDDDDELDVLPPRKKRDDEEMDITPMIDITFLLLIFFVVCSTMDPSKMGKIPKAERGTAVSAEDSAVIYIEPAGGDKVLVKRGDGRQFSIDEDAQVSEIIEYVTEQRERTLGKSKEHVMLFVDENTPMMHVTRIQRIIGDAFPEIPKTYTAVKEQ